MSKSYQPETDPNDMSKEWNLDGWVAWIVVGFQALLQKATFKAPTFTSVVNANKKLHDKEAPLIMYAAPLP